MEEDFSRKFMALDADIICECKNVNEGIDPSVALHNHDGHEIILLLGGELNLYMEFGGVRLERGDLICVREMEFHRGELLTRNQYDRIVINIKSGVLSHVSTREIDLETCFRRNSPKDLNVIRLSEQEITQMEDYAKALQNSLKRQQVGDELMIDAYLKLIMVIINRHFIDRGTSQKEDIMPELVAKTFEYIENHLSEEITLKKLENYVYHNGTYISRCFKRVAGITLQQFIIAKKISLSCKLLREGYPPVDVCYMTGFNNYSNYSRTFSNKVGLSPKKYQMINR